jgi:hypothetical protein
MPRFNPCRTCGKRVERRGAEFCLAHAEDGARIRREAASRTMTATWEERRRSGDPSHGGRAAEKRRLALERRRRLEEAG